MPHINTTIKTSVEHPFPPMISRIFINNFSSSAVRYISLYPAIFQNNYDMFLLSET